jgi:uncharacterized protein YjiS (DUF1127 family)
MATVVHTASGFSRFNPFPSLLAAIAVRWHARRHRARELQELFALDERELRDLGLSRSDFVSIQNGTYRRD